MRECCSECDGRGWGIFSCCGDDITGDINERDNCPSCGEHCGDEREDCEECDATGWEKNKPLNKKSQEMVDEFFGYLGSIFKNRKGSK